MGALPLRSTAALRQILRMEQENPSFKGAKISMRNRDTQFVAVTKSHRIGPRTPRTVAIPALATMRSEFSWSSSSLDASSMALRMLSSFT